MYSRLLRVSTHGGDDVMARRDCSDRPDSEYDVLRWRYGAVCRIATVALRRGSRRASFARFGVDRNNSCTRSMARNPTLMLSTADSRVNMISVT